MNSIDKLSEIFAKFPGIGPRQARRFVYFLLSRHGNFTQELTQAISELRREVTQCESCQRFYPSTNAGNFTCPICADDTRDGSMLMIVPRDIDLEAVEKSGSYNGHYFVLGGVVPILEKEPEKKVRINKLQETVDKKAAELKEVVLAMNANADGEHTAEYLKEKLMPSSQEASFIFSTLGRGLSTGTELEYADSETLKSAFEHRTK